MCLLGYRTLTACGLLTLLPLACGGRQEAGSSTGIGGMPSAATAGANTSAGTAGIALPQDEQFITDPCPDILAMMAGPMASTCSATTLSATFHYLNVLVVFDRSASLTLPGLPADGRSSWLHAVSAMRQFLRDTESLQRYGLVLFPALDATPGAWAESSTSCRDSLAYGLRVDVPISPASNSVPAIEALLDKTAPSGSSPMSDALAFAYDYFARGEGAALKGWKYVLLVTDGGANCNSGLSCAAEDCTTNLETQTSSPNCSAAGGSCCDAFIDGPSACLDDQRAAAQLSRLAAAQIKTFVLGAASNERYERALNALAVSGGVPNSYGSTSYYPTQGESGLMDAFTAISTSLVRTCVVPLESPPADPNKLRLYIDCSVVPRQMTDGTVNWRYELDAESNPRVVIEGVQCLRISATGVKRVDVLVGCAS